MDETKSYKNINANDLDVRARINCLANKAAFMVPRLLGKMAEKIIIKPITQLVTGQPYEDVKKDAVAMAMDAQKVEVGELDKKIEEGKANLEAWRADTDYLVGNMAEYKAYQSTIERLEKRRTRTLTSPKKINVGKAYLSVMKKRRKVRKMVQQVVNDYILKKENVKAKELEIKALEDALRTARQEYGVMTQDLQQFETENAEIVSQVNLDEGYVDAPVESVGDKYTIEEMPTTEVKAEEPAAPDMQNTSFKVPEVSDLGQAPVVPTKADQILLAQMANMANMSQAPVSNNSTLEAYGLSEEGKQKQM